MYVVPTSNPPEQPQFFLSSSWSGSNSVAENRLRQAVDPWRKEALATCLRQIARTGEGMPKSLPVFEPTYLKELCRLFWKTFRGKGKQSNGKPIIPSIALAKVHEKAAAQHLARYSDESRSTTIAFGEYFSPNSKVEPMLMSLLADVIKAKFNAGPINTPEVVEALMAFFEFCCTPQFQFPGGEIVKMVASPDNLQALWNKYHPGLEELLQALFTAQKTQTIPPGRPFGRCAKTYCFICMQIMYQQETSDGRSLLPFVKGIAMETRNIGTSDVFNSRFTSSILATAGANKNGPFRLPCENCDCLIPIFEMVPGATAYNSDLLTLQQKGSS